MVAYTFSISPHHLSNHADLSVSKYPLFSQNVLFWISLKRNKADIYIFRITVLRTFVKVSSLMFHFVVIHIFVCLHHISRLPMFDRSKYLWKVFVLLFLSLCLEGSMHGTTSYIPESVCWFSSLQRANRAVLERTCMMNHSKTVPKKYGFWFKCISTHHFNKEKMLSLQWADH